MRDLDADEVERLRILTFTYGDARPLVDVRGGFWTLRSSRRLGAGRELYERAADALMTWRMHERAGFTVAASDDVVSDGAVVVLGPGLGRLRLSAPCRVVEVERGDDACGFTYGTLPGHPASGQERFAVRLLGSGDVVAEIVAASRPAWRLARAAAPATRAAQRRIADRYLAALTALSYG